MFMKQNDRGQSVSVSMHHYIRANLAHGNASAIENCTSSITRQMRNTQGGPFNTKISSYQYRNSNFADKILWPSIFHNGISYTGNQEDILH